MDILSTVDLYNPSIELSLQNIFLYGYISNTKLISDIDKFINIVGYNCDNSVDEIFEENVKAISYIEDKLKIDIPYISISCHYKTDRTNIIEFYGNSKEFIINCDSSSDIIDTIAFIEFNRFNNVYIGINDFTCFKWICSRDLFYSIKKYVKCINNIESDNCINIKLEEYGYNGFLVK